MNAIAKQDDLGKLRAQVTALTPEFKMALPSHIKPEKFQRVLLTVVQQQPDLLIADRRTLFASCMKCAADGLVPDGREAALVIFNTKVKDQWVKAVQYMPMMAGLLKRVRNSNEVSSVQAHVIYGNDQFLIRRGLSDTLEHTPLFPGDRGSPIGAYAVAKFKDGSDPVFEVMDLNQINKVRQISRAKDGPTWTQHWDEMARKTVFRRLSKWLPMDAEDEAVMRRDDEVGTIEHASPAIEAVVGQDRVAAPSRLDALADLSGETITDDGEVLSGEVEPAADLSPAAADLIASIEATNTQRDLDVLLRQDAVRAQVKAFTGLDADRVSVATQAQQRGFAGAAQGGGR